MDRPSSLLSIGEVSPPTPAAEVLEVGELDPTTADDVPRPFWRRRSIRWRPRGVGAGRERLAWALAAFLAIVLIAALVTWRLSSGGPPPLTQADVNRAVQSGIAQEQKQERANPPDAASAYRRIFPSMVTILDSKVSPEAGKDTTGEGALGAGVVIDAQGQILTALHVVAGGGRIQVRFTDGTQATATVLKKQPASDIAVLGVDKLPSVVVPAVMAGGAGIGDAVFPVGHPLGLQDSLSAGVVSALDRTIQVAGGRTLKGLIQFDAAVNPGNSGGPLLDRDGHVLGIVTGLANPSQQGFFVGIGFAVPIATAGGVAGGPSK
jgi:S1-C subfamily serine protease